MLVTSSVQTTEEATAQKEFVRLFKKATGSDIPVVKDNTAIGSSVNYISLGYTNLLNNVDGLNLTEERAILGESGARLLTYKDNVYLYGGSDLGTVFSVYTFMQEYFDFEQYSRNAFYIDKVKGSVTLKELDIYDVPDIAYRYPNVRALMFNYGYDELYEYESLAGLTKLDVENRDRAMRIDDGNVSQISMAIFENNDTNNTPTILHNSLNYIMGQEQTHPLWFSKNSARNGCQICYTAGGDSSEYAALVKHCADSILYSMAQYSVSEKPYHNYITMLQMDSGNFCECDGCKGKPVSGLIVNFANDVIDDVYARMNTLPEDNRRDNLKLVVHAYQDSFAVPADYTNGEWVMKDGYEKPNKNVVMWVAPNKMVYTHSIYDDINAEQKKNIEGWSAITEADEMWYWLYNFYYLCDNYFCDNFDFITDETISFLVANKASYIKDEMTGIESPYNTAFTDLKSYLDSKLYWDSSLDSDVLIQNYFDNVYLEASSEMKAIFNTARTNATKYNGTPCNIWINKTEYFSYQFLKDYISALDGAMAKIDSVYSSDLATAELIKSRIACEYVFPYLAIFELYSDELSSDTLYDTYQANFLSIINAYFPNYQISVHPNAVSSFSIILKDYVENNFSRS